MTYLEITNPKEKALKMAKIVGRRLKELRETLGMSMATFAREARLDYSQYYRIEEGLNLPSYMTMVKLIKEYNIDPYYLLGLDNSKEGKKGDDKNIKRKKRSKT